MQDRRGSTALCLEQGLASDTDSEVQSFIQSIHLLSTYFVPGTVLGIQMNRVNNVAVLMGLSH